MAKSEIREKYRQQRHLLSQQKITVLSEMIFENFKESFKITEGQNIHCFLTSSGKNEVQTQLFIEYFQACNCRIFVPKVVADRMISVQFSSQTSLFPNKWGIPEPENDAEASNVSFDYVLVPLLYADHLGNRVGYGKGFYDDFFASINPEALKIGVNFFSPDEIIDDVREKDIPLNYLVTPTEMLSFGNGASKLTK